MFRQRKWRKPIPRRTVTSPWLTLVADVDEAPLVLVELVLRKLLAGEPTRLRDLLASGEAERTGSSVSLVGPTAPGPHLRLHHSCMFNKRPAGLCSPARVS